jgi:Spy/CpxP family protein refolding chaperone
VKDSIESIGRIRAQGFIVIVVALLVGGVLGVTAERARAARRVAQVAMVRGRPPRAPGEMRPGPGGGGAFERLGRMPPAFDRLDLSDDQKARIQEIFESQRPLTDSIMRATFVQIDAIRDSVSAAVESVLTPEQRDRFREIIQEERQRFRDRFNRDGPGRGRRGFRRDSQ